ncbi:MAG: hypothetical protein JKY32_16810 [Rhizobiales bacterium]|nr:hypothetical protein [Hyphomicrobiales bacterium]
MPESIMEWIAWSGIVLPLMVLSWSAYRYVSDRRREIQHQEYERFYELMDTLAQANNSISGKMAALYELRKFPQYQPVIIRLIDDVPVKGDASGLLKKEMLLTKNFFETGKE